MTPEERFWSYVDQSGECWLWTKSTAGNGYGQYGYYGYNTKTHRLAWRLTYGPIPPGYRVRQDCRNRLCCNPDHLTLVTPSQQSRLSVTEGTNRESRKTHCPRGHLLASPNLCSSSLRKEGRRRCLACKRTKKVAQRPELKPAADERYELIMRGMDRELIKRRVEHE